MKEIMIAFEGFWNGFQKEHNFITEILEKKYYVKVLQPTDEEERKQVQYLFFSCFSDSYLDYSCVRIFFTGENIAPDFNVCDYAIGFDYIQLEDRYIRYPLYLSMYDDDLYKAIEKNKDIDDKYLNRKFCSMVVSNVKDAESKRKDFFDLLCEYKQVNSGGRYLNNVGEPQGVENKEKFQGEHKFSIAFENSSHSGYCTEKLVQGFAAKTVPIYWGDETVEEQFNGKSFVNCHKYDSFHKVIEQIEKIDHDDELYLSMLKEPAISEEKVKKDKTEFYHWLYHIIEQDIQTAYRRNRYGRCALYERQLLHIQELEEKETRRNRNVMNRFKNKLMTCYKGISGDSK